MSTDVELHYALMESGRMNLMHLPSGAISWLWDRPASQVDAAEQLAVAANSYGNPIVDASLLKADQNVLIIRCEGGQCFRIYPDGGYSCDGTPMDIGGCSSILQGGSVEPGCDDLGHAMDPADELDAEIDNMHIGDPLAGNVEDPSPGDGYNDAMDVAVLDDIGNDEHMMPSRQPRSGVATPQGMTNLAGEPTVDEDAGGDWGGPGTGDGMGTGSPYVGDMSMSASPELANLVMSRGIGENMFKDADDGLLEDLARDMGLTEDYKDYPQEAIEQELENIAEWMRTDVNNLQLRSTTEPMSTFAQDVEERIHDLDWEDEERVEEITRLVTTYRELWPVFVEENDPDNFILEGRHRILAYWNLGVEQVPVIRVSRKD